MAYYPPKPQSVQPIQQKKRMKLGLPAKIGIGIVAAIVLFYAVALAFGVSTPAYIKGQMTLNFARDGKLGPAYSVAVSKQCTDAELIQVYRDVIRNDGYSIHAVGIWSSAELMNNGWGVDVAMIMDDTGTPVLQRVK